MASRVNALCNVAIADTLDVRSAALRAMAKFPPYAQIFDLALWWELKKLQRKLFRSRESTEATLNCFRCDSTQGCAPLGAIILSMEEALPAIDNLLTWVHSHQTNLFSPLSKRASLRLAAEVKETLDLLEDLRYLHKAAEEPLDAGETEPWEKVKADLAL